MPLLLGAMACAPKESMRRDAPATMIYVKVLCPSADEAARRAYEGATDAERNGNVQRAEALYREAVQRDPAFCDAMDNLAVLLRRQGKLDAAIDWYRKSLTVNPKNPVARLNLGMALRLKGNLDESLREYEILLQQEPNDAEAHYGIGSTFLEKQEWRKAHEHFERAEKLYWVQRPEFIADATFMKGVTEWQMGDCRAAIASLESIEATRRDDADLNYILGVCLLDGHKAELAKGVPEGTPWVDRARTYLRRASAGGKTIDPTIARALRL